MKATQEQVSAMKARLAERMEQRKLEADIQEAINLVHRVPFGQPQEVTAETVEPGEDSGGFHQGTLVAAWLTIECLKCLGKSLWLVGLVMLLTAFLMYGMRCFL